MCGLQNFFGGSGMQKEAHISRVEDVFNGSIIELCLAWSALDEQWLDLVNDMSEDFLNEKIELSKYER